jgi:hypothetical protein
LPEACNELFDLRLNPLKKASRDQDSIHRRDDLSPQFFCEQRQQLQVLQLAHQSLKAQSTRRAVPAFPLGFAQQAVGNDFGNRPSIIKTNPTS